MNVREKELKDQPWIEQILNERWGGEGRVIAHGDTFDARLLPALVAGEQEGLATYQIRQTGDTMVAELITLDAVTVKQGIGTALIEGLIAKLRAEGAGRPWLFLSPGHWKTRPRRNRQHHQPQRRVSPPQNPSIATSSSPVLIPISDLYSINCKYRVRMVRMVWLFQWPAGYKGLAQQVSWCRSPARGTAKIATILTLDI